MNIFGKNMTIPGINVNSETKIMTPRIKKIKAVQRTIVGTFIIEVVVYIVTPTGGVIPPIVTMIIINIPK